MRLTRITIVNVRKPESFNSNVNELLQWFGGTIGLFNVRDKDRSCFRIFIVLLKDLKKQSEGLTSDEISELTSLSRGTVVHHLNNLMRTGIVISSRNKYSLKVNTLKELVDVVQNDTDVVFEQLRDVGEKIDSLLGLERK